MNRYPCRQYHLFGFGHKLIGLHINCIGYGQRDGGSASYTYSGGSATVNPSSNNSYTVTRTSSVGCINPVGVVSTVTVNVNPTITLNSGTVYAGASFTLSPSGTASYTFPGGSPVATPSANVVTYSVAGASSAGCQANAVTTVAMHALPNVAATAVNTMICAGETTTLFATGLGSFVWSTSKTSSVIVVTLSTSKTFTVSGANSNGCVNQATVTRDVSPCDGITEWSGAQTISLYPNPNNGQMYIEMSAIPGNSRIEVYSYTGQLILSEEIRGTITPVNLGTVANGLHTVRVIAHNKSVFVSKVIKQ